MRYLITGGAGFIGSHLADFLLAQGHEVMALDDLSTGAAENAPRDPRFRLVIGSCGDPRALGECMGWADAVFHLAAAVGVELIVASPVRAIETNVAPTELVLREAAKRGTKVLFASTSEVYGKSAKVPFSENDDAVIGPPVRGRWAYACSKLLGEFLALAYWKERRVPVVVARLFNTVGPRQSGRYGMVLPRFIDQALSGGPITVYGDGTQTRCFTYVGDVVRGLVALVEAPAAVGEIVNLGSREEISIRALAERVRERLAPQVEIVQVPYEKAYEPGFEDMSRRVADISKARRLIGWEPKIGLDAIIDEVAQWKRRPAGPPEAQAFRVSREGGRS
jgi:UDP-glucose 4-epimerase